MSISRIVFFILFIWIVISCKNDLNYSYILPQNEILEKKELSESEISNWHHKDIIDDTIPGISLNKAYNTLLKDKTGKEIVIAVIDMEIDIYHEDLHDNIWLNKKEIPDNKIDDDNNGYIDDIYGWNFLRNIEGETSKFVNYEYTRVLRKYDSLFNGKTIDKITDKNKLAFLTYKRAKEQFNKKMKFALEDKRNGDLLYNNYYKAKKELSQYFPKENFTIKKLDSIKSINSENEELKEHISLLIDCIKYDLTEKYINDYKLKADERIQKLLNLKFDDREKLNDDPNNILDIKYGSNVVNANIDFFEHGTLVAGVIAASRSNNVGAKGFSNYFKIMPLCISSFGDEHDKDIALAIRYAVDNGAKVINMSFGKDFSLYKEWVDDALKYAEKNNVLVITSAGNNGINLDNDEENNYPTDIDLYKKEIVGNFIKVGESSYHLNEKLKTLTSNYGKQYVDVFAPGFKIMTTTTKPIKYVHVNGTSISSAIVSGVAGLLFSYYPNLTAKQVKQIILQSGVEFNISINIPIEKDKNEVVNFKNLSKSGKIVNAYNSLIMADSISSIN